jgi:hypothetical protein
MKILEFADLDTSRVKPAYRKVVAAIANGDFRAAQVRKLAGAGHGKLYRARLNDADLGFGHIYVSRPLPCGHRGRAEQQGRHADENGRGKKIKPAHIMRPEQGLEPVWKAQRLQHPALAAMESR